MWLINNRNVLLTALVAESLRLGCQHGQLGAFFWGADFSLYPHMVEGARVLPWASFIRALISFMRVPHS